MALLRHSGIYFLACIVTGAAGFAILAAYTRLLNAQEFGELALALAVVSFFTAPIVDGALLTLLRYMPDDPKAARATALWGLVAPEVGRSISCGRCGAMKPVRARRS